MKVHYINILLFAFPLNILVHNQRNHKESIFRIPKTKPTKTHRTLCECEIYAPSNYDNDHEMKEVMEIFDRQTSERFHEYDERIQDKRKQCKEQCDKDIQKIILKDKIEKELTEKFATLQTSIDNNDIPTCVCEKSMAVKVEKTCLKCGGILGTTVPELALLGGISTHMLTTAATSAATKAGMQTVILELKQFLTYFSRHAVDLTPIVNPSTYNNGTALLEGTMNLIKPTCVVKSGGINSTLCSTLEHTGTHTFNNYAQCGIKAYNEKFKAEMVGITSFNNAMIASIVAIVIIILVMVIIYFILRYRRKRKMKKKLQYMKLLNQ
ncbi:hypothetical protein PFAG_00840 [Plasmodium falciparum Santa Lucia]|uniref:Surface antigen n=2 Tax=Plasmodium falciparum TaxID=5833 RepID=A0A024VJX4_PLAFA|nr:hypothetical protein PFFCH_03765 [Plasmodium falciparum FCH/4]EUT91013.1 hypothetical protein PFAG_00840 [Plasmodium falciparum Santa Lucia]